MRLFFFIRMCNKTSTFNVFSCVISEKKFFSIRILVPLERYSAKKAVTGSRNNYL